MAQEEGTTRMKALESQCDVHPRCSRKANVIGAE